MVVQLRGLAAGAATFAVLHALFAATWTLWFQPASLEQPWFLGSKRSLLVTQVAFGALALAWSLPAPPGAWRRRFVGAAWLLAGALAAVAAAFGLLGPDRLLLGPVERWPVALLSAAVLLALPILAGTLLGGVRRVSGGASSET